MVSLFGIELILIFAFAFEVMQLEQYFLLLLFGIAFIESNNCGKFRVAITREFLVLVTGFTVFYFSMLLLERIPINAFYMLRYWLGPILAYYVGITIGNGSVKRVAMMITVIALGALLHGCLNVLTTTSFSATNRYAVNFWTGSIITATLQGTYFVFASALSVSWLLHGLLSKKVLAVAIMGLTIWNCMQTASRTPLYLLGMILVCSIVLNEYIETGRKGVLTFFLKATLILGAVIGFAFVAYQNDLLGMRTFFESSFLGKRLAGIDEEGAMSRRELWLDAIKNISIYPFGVAVREHYAHNLWLDIGLNGGVMPMLFVFCYSCMSYKTMLQVCKQGVKKPMRVMVYLIYFATAVSFMLEPILQGVPYTFCCFVIMNGAIASLQVRDD